MNKDAALMNIFVVISFDELSKTSTIFNDFWENQGSASYTNCSDFNND